VIGRAARAYPALMRVGFAGLVAYRTEFLIWILTTNMPLVMLALWRAVAAEGPVGRFGAAEFSAYYVAVLFVRILTGSWMVWQLTMDIRQGLLAPRLLRPVHPLVAYSAEHLAAVPLRLLVVSPLLAVLFAIGGSRLALQDPVRLVLFLAAVAGAWLILFFTMAIIGTLAIYIESALSVFEIWFACHTVLSGYLVPLELLPEWVSGPARWLPFRYALAFPVELLVGLQDTASAVRDLGVQWLYVVGLFAGTAAMWRAGMKRFVAFGG
jgi:ABC-2 type transport system permease protein